MTGATHKILFLGGTSFVGRHIAEALIAAGHDVTFFHRGTTNPSPFPEHRHIHGDRYGDVSVLAGVSADIVVDTSGYTPDSVAASASAVSASVRTYAFMSSVDAYDLSAASVDETSATKPLPEGATTSEAVPDLYGAHKALAEQRAIAVLGAERVIAIRAGLMVGPYDKTDRFTYWPARVARGGDILTPVGPAMPVQFIDVRDVAAWTAGAVANRLHGTFSLVGTPGALTVGDVLDACRAAAPGDARFAWASTEFLQAHDVGPWVELPLWLPPLPELAGLLKVSNDKARASGLRLRPLAETVRDVLDEFRQRPTTQTLRAGLNPAREAELLAALRRG
jgi:2'-hydroxyisoflavone reductase